MLNKKIAFAMCSGIAGILGLAALSACASKVADGGVDEQTNTLAGILVDDLGKPVSGAAVMARHTSVNTEFFTDTTDEKGNFGFPLQQLGAYGLYSVVDSKAVFKVVTYDGSNKNIDKLQIAETRDYKGRIAAGNVNDFVGSRVYLPGSPWEARMDSLGNFVLEDIPEGMYMLVAESPDPVHYSDASFGINVSSDDFYATGPLPTSLAVTSSAIMVEKAQDIVVYNPSGNVSTGSVELVLPASTDYGLVSWISMDNVSVVDGKQTTSDARGHVDDVILYGDDLVVAGLSGKALRLASPSQFGVIENDKHVFDNLTEMSLELILQIDTVVGKGPYRRNIVGKLGFEDNDKNVFSFALINGDCGVSGTAVAFFIADGSGDSLSCANAVVSSKGIAYGKWSSYTVTWNGETLSMYLNGNLDAQKNVSVSKLQPSDEPIFFGKENINVILDDVRLGEKAISPADVLYRYYLRGGSL